MERQFYLLAYDIADSRRLARVSRHLESQGERVQDSVFEAYLDSSELDRLLKKARKLLDMESDSLRVYQICASCKGKVLCLGQGRVTPAPGLVII